MTFIKRKKKHLSEWEKINGNQIILYVRESTDGQAKNGFGKDLQIRAMLQLCEEKGLEVAKVFIEGEDEKGKRRGVSGKTKKEDRKSLMKMFDYMEENNINASMVYDTSRISRDDYIQGQILNEYEEEGWVMISATEEDIMSTDPNKKLLTGIKAKLNEYELDKIRERTSEGRIQKAASGGHAAGRVPVGYKRMYNNSTGKFELVPNEDDFALIERVFYLRDIEKMSFQKIADKLNKEGFKPANCTTENKTKFWTSTVQKIYKNPKYLGRVTYYEDGEKLVDIEKEEWKIINR